MSALVLHMEEEWSDDIEKILNDIRQNSVILSEFHNMKYFHLKSYLKYFRIPCIILSAFNSVFAVGLSSFMEQNLVSVINCIISLICGIIVSIELYMQIESSMREEVISCKNYYLLSVDIQKILLLERSNRQVKGKVFLDKCFTEYCKLYENSGLLKKQIKDSLTPLAPELIGKPLKKPLELTYTPPPTPSSELALEPVKKNILKNLNFLSSVKKNKEEVKDKVIDRFYKLESGINENENENEDDNLDHLEEVTKNILEEEKRQLENITKTNNALKKGVKNNLEKSTNKTNEILNNEVNTVVNNTTIELNNETIEE
jgi:hypothetical protein